MIRKVLPNTIVNDLISVQPMAGVHGQVFSMSAHWIDVNAYHGKVETNRDGELIVYDENVKRFVSVNDFCVANQEIDKSFIKRKYYIDRIKENIGIESQTFQHVFKPSNGAIK